MDDVRELKLGALYKHYKGGVYLALQVVTDASRGRSGHDLVLYLSVVNNRLFVRDLPEWFDEVEVEGEKVPRFSLLTTS